MTVISDNSTKKSLLPSGFQDILPPHAAEESSLISTLMHHYSQFNYLQVKPPMVEFEETLLGGEMQLSALTFRVLDPKSHAMMAIRSDMTPQIARMAALRLHDAPRPLRLCYTGNVLRVSGGGLFAERQLGQCGTEIIGSKDSGACAESVIVAASALHASGVTDVSVDFNLPGLSSSIMDAYNVKDTNRDLLLNAIEAKDNQTVKNVGEEAADLLITIINIANESPLKEANETLEALLSLPLPEAGRNDCLLLKDTILHIINSGIDISVTIDPLERNGFEYHRHVSFALFSSKTGEELGRGGCYTIELNNEPATGFTLNVNALNRAISSKSKAHIPVYAPANIAFSTITALQKAGYVICRGLTTAEDNHSEAIRLNCSGIVQENGSIIPLT